MQVTKMLEAGYEMAKYGFSLSYKDRAINRDDWWCPLDIGDDWWQVEEDPPQCQRVEGCNSCPLQEKSTRYDKVLNSHSGLDKGKNKFLEHIMVWLDVDAPRYFWSEFDTYRVGVSKQSESTMHTLSRRDVNEGDFEGGCIRVDTLMFLNDRREDLQIQELKSYLPESYLQRREIVLSYKVLRHIILQRLNHRLPEWGYFIKEVLRQVEHPKLLPLGGKDE